MRTFSKTISRLGGIVPSLNVEATALQVDQQLALWERPGVLVHLGSPAFALVNTTSWLSELRFTDLFVW